MYGVSRRKLKEMVFFLKIFILKKWNGNKNDEEWMVWVEFCEERFLILVLVVIRNF